MPQMAVQSPAPPQLPKKQFLENQKQTGNFQSICGTKCYEIKSNLGELTLWDIFWIRTGLVRVGFLQKYILYIPFLT